MTTQMLETIANQLWRDAAMEFSCPAPIEQAVQTALPIWVAKWPSVDVPGVGQMLTQLGLVDPPIRDDQLRGCLFADRGRNIIFVCGHDPSDEQRLTVAHEAAHFLLDYDRPRRAVVAALGEGTVAVLDGQRPPTERERMHAVLARVRLGPYLHLLPRIRHQDSYSSAAATVVERAEADADWLALELVAPRWLVCELIQATPKNAENCLICQNLADRLGIPAYALEPLIARLHPPRRLLGLLDHVDAVLRQRGEATP